MGMGEPFLNYENFVKAGRLLVEHVGIADADDGFDGGDCAADSRLWRGADPAEAGRFP